MCLTELVLPTSPSFSRLVSTLQLAVGSRARGLVRSNEGNKRGINKYDT